MVILLILASASLLATWISPYSPIKTSLAEMLDRPSPIHPMGTDELGRDLLARILHGGRVSLAIGFLAVALAVSIGSTVGAIAGFYGGWVDNLLMRLVDFMIALPSIFVLILLATIYGTNPVTLVLVIGGLRWMGTGGKEKGRSKGNRRPGDWLEPYDRSILSGFRSPLHQDRTSN